MPASMPRTWTGTTIMAALLALTAACSSGDSLPAVNTWPQDLVYPYGQGPAPSPEFPTSLTGWEMAETWSDMPRAFSGNSWTVIAGPDGERFPSTMNGCSNQRFLVRWRSVTPETDIATRWNQADVEFGNPVVGEAGWLDLDGCAGPEVRLENAEPGGSNLTDVAVRVQRWIPAA